MPALSSLEGWRHSRGGARKLAVQESAGVGIAGDPWRGSSRPRRTSAMRSDRTRPQPDPRCHGAQLRGRQCAAGVGAVQAWEQLPGLRKDRPRKMLVCALPTKMRSAAAPATHVREGGPAGVGRYGWRHSGRLTRSARLETVRSHHLRRIACRPSVGGRSGRRMAPRSTTITTTGNRPC